MHPQRRGHRKLFPTRPPYGKVTAGKPGKELLSHRVVGPHEHDVVPPASLRPTGATAVAFWVAGHGEPPDPGDARSAQDLDSLRALAEDAIVRRGRPKDGFEIPWSVDGPQQGDRPPVLAR